MAQRNVVALILGGGRGTRLAPLTSIRSKPAVPLGGSYRLIDVPISNCINSGINKIYVLTQFLSVSLHRHIRRSYSFDHFSGGYVELLAAMETTSKGSDWYEGTADAVRKNLRYFDDSGVDHVVVLSGDQLYRMNYSDLIRTHRESSADATIACLPVTREAARGFGIMQIDDSGRVTGFVEKPKTDDEIDRVRTDPNWIKSKGIDPKGRDCIASMGIYVFNRDLLHELLTQSEEADFGKGIFPQTIKTHRVQMHLFDGYWEDIGTIRSFYESNLSMAADNPEFELTLPDSPIYTRARFLPPTRMSGANVKNSLISNGCHIAENAMIENSVIGLRTIIGPNVIIKDSIVMGNDFYETDNGKLPRRRIPMEIGEGTVIQGAIIDKNVSVGKGARIVNASGRDSTDLEHPTCVIRDGIPIVIKNSVIEANWDLDQDLP